MGNRIVIIGAGGHGKVVYDAISAQNTYSIVGFVDSLVAVGTAVKDNCTVICEQRNISELEGIADYFIVAIGNNSIREQVFSAAADLLQPATVIHPSAVFGLDIIFGKGSVALANCVINTNSFIGENSIVNSGVVIDHDCKIGKSVHLAIGTMVGSNSIVGNGYSSGIGEHINSFSKIA